MKKVISGIVFFLILLAILIGLGFLFSPDYLFKNQTLDKKSDINTRLANEEPYTLDIIILGDSESYTSISPLEWWRDYGYSAYNFGLIGGKVSDVRESLKTILNSQKPKLVLLETNTLYRSDNRGEEASNSISRFIYDLLPITKYHDNWKVPFQDTRKGYYKGFTISHTIDPCDNKEYMIPSDDEDNIMSDNIKTLNEINELCQNNDAKLILYSAPSPPNYNYAKHNSISKVASDMGLEYIDLNLLNNELKIDYTTDTRDGGDHLNAYGAIKATAYIGKYINNKYDITDRRNTSIASANNQLLEDYIRELNDN